MNQCYIIRIRQHMKQAAYMSEISKYAACKIRIIVI